MKVKEWLQSKGKYDSTTFIIARAEKYENSKMYDFKYRTTPIRTVEDWLKGETAEKYIVIKADHAPIDISGGWTNWYKSGHLHCAIITTEEELYTMYSEAQAKDMLEWYDEEVRKQMNK